MNLFPSRQEAGNILAEIDKIVNTVYKEVLRRDKIYREYRPFSFMMSFRRCVMRKSRNC